MSSHGLRDFSYFNPFVNPSGKRILDVGSGSGRKTAFYSTKGGEAIGVDISKTWVRKSHLFVRDRQFNQVDFIVAESGHLPFQRHFFDIVISNDTLEHFKDLRKAVLEMERVVKSSGYVCLSSGPLWLSPFGSHIDFGENFFPPWAHLIFSEKIIKDTLISIRKVKDTERNKPLFMHLNRVTAKEFQEMLKDTKLNVLLVRLRTVPPFGPLMKTPFREFLTTGVIALLQRAAD
jgi:ubiquinone/menaquinone biosynthesis C-methylase UbiE